MRIRSVLVTVVMALLAALVGLPGALTSAQAVQLPQDRVVSDDPANFTPNVLDGQVNAIMQAGTKIIIGGSFSQVQNAGSSTTITRNNILAFNATTGVVDTTFVPSLDGEVTSLALASDGQSVYVGGKFNNVTTGGTTVRSKSLTRLNVSNGARTSGFTVPTFGAVIQDLKLSGNRLFVAGTFATIARQARTGLAALNAATGALLPDVNFAIAGTHNGGVTQVYKIDVTPDGSKLVAIGNFATVNGQDRVQAALINLSANSSYLADWETDAYKPMCYSVFQFYVRDVEFAPDGSYFAIGVTGGYGSGPPSLCDTVTRWETSATGSGVSPTWADYTGGDTTYAVGVTSHAIYVGGHQRWWNNPFAADSPGPGAVARTGIGALDPENGLPLSWNPTRTRGSGVFDFLVTPTGLWVASDTDRIGNFEYHGRIAFFPLAGGKVVPPNVTGSLPGTVYQLGQTASSDSPVLYRVNAAGPPMLALDSGPDWSGDTGDSPSGLHEGGSNAADWGSPAASLDPSVPDTTPPAIFSTERWAEQHWHFPVPDNLPLQVRLYFANRYGGTSQVGKRVFDVSIDGQLKLDDYDIVADVGDQRGVMKAFNITSDGQVDIDLGQVVENPLINGIEILRTDISPPPPGSGAADSVTSRSFDGSTAGTAAHPANGGIAWSRARGAVMISGKVYYGWSDGQLYSRTYNGTTWGAAVAQNTADQIVSNGPWHADVPNITSMFFENGKLYYTLFGQSSLFYRYFLPESAVVGAQRFTAANNLSDVDWRTLDGAFLANGKLWYGTGSDGNLHRLDWNNGPVGGSAATVSGPGIDGVDWRGRAMFLYADANGTPPNQPPVAKVSVSCTGLTCTATSTGSSDPDGQINSYAWDLGDNKTSTAQNPPQYTYSQAGTYTVKLTVTDNGGATGTASQQVTVAPVNQEPTASFTVNCQQLTCSFNGTNSSDPDQGDSIASYSWNFGDNSAPGSGVTTSHPYAAGQYTVTLTVTDQHGASGTTTRTFQVSNQVAQISFAGMGQGNGNFIRHDVVVPNTVQAGDTLLLFFSTNSNTVSIGAPGNGVTGWLALGTPQTSGTEVTRVWSKVAAAGDAGKTVSIQLSAIAKGDILVAAYRGANGTTPVAQFALTGEAAAVAAHTTPAVSSSAQGSWLVSYWADKSSATTDWTVPADLTKRSTSIGAGSGRITALFGDSGQAVAIGSLPGLTATAKADTADSPARANMASVVLAP